MSINPYDTCPCGSGKKHKWCCQPIDPLVEKSVAQFNGGQQEGALRTMDELVRDFPTNPQAYGHKAQLLMAAGRVEEADKALDQAFAINPNYPFGLLLRGMMRQQEGEMKGALLLFRKAVDAYDPTAKGPLGQLYDLIGNTEIMFNRPVAARFALQRTLELFPAEQEFRQQFTALFEEPGRFPESARKQYHFRPVRKGTKLDPRGKLSETVKVLDQVAQETPDDPAVWFNLGLSHAWSGDNAKALEALHRSVEHESNDDLGTEAVALAEVLRCGVGMEEQSDHVEHRVIYRIREPQGVMKTLQDWDSTRRLMGTRQNKQDGSISALVMEEGQVAVTFGPALAKLGAYVYIVGEVIRLWHPRKESVEKIAKELVAKSALGVQEVRWDTGPTQFADVVVEAVQFPTGEGTDEELEKKLRSETRRYFEEVWANRPLKALSNLTPDTVAKNPASRKKVLGLVRFLEECFELSVGGRQEPPEGEEAAPRPEPLYNFDRLRQKLGLGGAVSAPAVESPSAGPDVGAMSVEQLTGLSLEGLGDVQLEEAFRTAMKQGDRAQADRFAGAVIARPFHAATPDRYPFYNQLIQSAQNAGDADRVVQLLEDAARVDQEQNEGKRQGDYLLRRGQALMKRGQIDNAVKVFEELAGSEAAEPKHVGSAVESLLSAKQPSHALRLGEQGLALARKKGSRDSEGYFLELIAAAKKQGG